MNQPDELRGAMDLIDAHSCVEQYNPERVWPARFHCKCGMELVEAINFQAKQHCFVVHIVTEATLAERQAAESWTI